MLKKEGFPPWQWARFRSAIFLLLVSVSSAFAAVADVIPDAEYSSVTVALFVFSSLIMVRFIFFSERYRKYRKVFFALVVIIGFLHISDILYSSINFLYSNTESETSKIILKNIKSILLDIHEILFKILITLAIVAAIISLIVGFFLIYKKSKFIIISALSILAIEIVTVILIVKCEIIGYEAMFTTSIYLAILNGILGIISIICLLISLRSKISNNRHKQK